MKEPEISVGIVNAQEIHFSLNGNFFAKGETVCGEQQVAFSEGGILWNGNLYRELTFTPQDEHASFSLYDVPSELISTGNGKKPKVLWEH